MLYVSTRNLTDTFTAHRALHETHAPDGGLYIPFRLPVFSEQEISVFKSQRFSKSLSDILNMFFGLRLNYSDVESILGIQSCVIQNINQNLLIAELWHTPDGNYNSIVKKLYHLITEKSEIPAGWVYIAIEIAVLFGLYSDFTGKGNSFDMAVAVNDFAGVTAALFAKDMGLPVRFITCAGDENGIIWDLVNRGEFSTNIAGDLPCYFELFLYKCAGNRGVIQYLDVCGKRGIYRIDEEYLSYINDNLYAAVVSPGRAEAIISGMYRTNHYSIDCGTALAYGSLQDYRASVGVNNDTLILAKKSPERIKE